jgi:quercetin dioxygenase-like cupin family protein
MIAKAKVRRLFFLDPRRSVEKAVTLQRVAAFCFTRYGSLNSPLCSCVSITLPASLCLPQPGLVRQNRENESHLKIGVPFKTGKKLIMEKLIPILGMSILAVVAKAQDPAKVDPAHYRVLLNNERVRILEVRQKPGYKSPMHSHPSHAVYSLTGSTLKFTSADGKTKTVTTKAGQVVWRKAETHTVENTGKTESHALDIELKN